MADVFDYLKWRGDLRLSQDGFNNVDAVILSRLSYIQLDGVLPDGETLSLREIADRFFADEKRPAQVLWKGDAELLRAAADSNRFGTLPLSCYVNIIDGESRMQFSAVLIDLGNQQFISYRGTDNTLVGWQEDLAMFCHFPLASQQKALAYFEEQAARFDGSFILGGHSKGGNLAVYAAAFCSDSLRNRIDAVYSLDGPGFERKNLENSGFESICDKIHTYVPQSSIFGMLLEHQEAYTVVQSQRKGFMQHDIYSWEIDCTDLITLPQTTATSAFFDHTLTSFVDGMTIEQREQLADGVFEILSSADVVTFDEMLDNMLKNIGRFLSTLKNMDGDTRSLILSQFGKLMKSAGKNLSDVNPLRRQNRKRKKKDE